MIMDKTEDAFEAGIEALEKNGTNNKKFESLNESSDDSLNTDSDFDIYGTPLPSSSKKAQKRKHSDELKKLETEKQKVDYTSNIIYDYFIEQILNNVAEKVILETVEKKSLNEEVVRQLNEIQSNFLVVSYIFNKYAYVYEIQ